MQRRYQALRVIGSIYKGLGGFTAVLTSALAVFILGRALLAASSQAGPTPGPAILPSLGGFLGGLPGAVFLTLLVILYGGWTAVTLYGLGEGVYLILAVEENTRTTAHLLRTMAQE